MRTVFAPPVVSMIASLLALSCATYSLLRPASTLSPLVALAVASAIVPTTVFVAPSITDSAAPLELATYTRPVVSLTAMLFGSPPTPIVANTVVGFAASRTVTDPPLPVSRFPTYSLFVLVLTAMPNVEPLTDAICVFVVVSKTLRPLEVVT